MLSLRQVGGCLIATLNSLSPAAASATVVTLDFSSLPSAQGWVYEQQNTIAPEASVFSLNGSTLVQDSRGVGFAGQGENAYRLSGVVDPACSFSMETRARVTDETGNFATNSFGFAFGAILSNGEAHFVGIGTARIEAVSEEFVITAIDNTQFHLYRLRVVPGVGYDLFVDGTLVGSGAPAGSAPEGLLLGDSTGGTNARVEVTAFRFIQCCDASCIDEIGMCLDSEGQCQADLATVSGDFASCTTNLAQRNGDLLAAQAALASATADTDGDGRREFDDRCADTAAGEQVDDSGCSQAQFCGGMDATTSDGARACRKADWGNDEPTMHSRDRDCIVDRGATGRADDRCVPAPPMP